MVEMCELSFPSLTWHPCTVPASGRVTMAFSPEEIPASQRVCIPAGLAPEARQPYPQPPSAAPEASPPQGSLMPKQVRLLLGRVQMRASGALQSPGGSRMSQRNKIFISLPRVSLARAHTHTQFDDSVSASFFSSRKTRTRKRAKMRSVAQR